MAPFYYSKIVGVKQFYNLFFATVAPGQRCLNTTNLDVALWARCAYTSLYRKAIKPGDFSQRKANMEKAEKAVNYTPEQTAKMVADYTAGIDVETIAKELGKTVRSVVAKLSREGVYKAKEYVNKRGEKPVAKDTIADAIGRVLMLSEGEVDSLTKANKSALEKIFKALAESVPIR